MENKNETGFFGVCIATVLAVIGLTITLSISHVLWPLVRLIMRLIWKCVQKIARNGWAKVKAPAKVKARAASLPTPAVFQGMSNLAPAKQIRLR